jgi:hypothetical protein
MWQQEAESRLRSYAAAQGVPLLAPLGHGADGIVVGSARGHQATAIKSLAFQELYQNERNVYLRLMDHDVDQVEGFSVPRLLWADDERWVIEMEVVSPPFVLDFAGAYLDQPPDYPPDVIEDWEMEKRDQFGEERWEMVRIVMYEFQQMGIYLADVKPGNIMFAD